MEDNRLYQSSCLMSPKEYNIDVRGPNRFTARIKSLKKQHKYCIRVGRVLIFIPNNLWCIVILEYEDLPIET